MNSLAHFLEKMELLPQSHLQYYLRMADRDEVPLVQYLAQEKAFMPGFLAKTLADHLQMPARAIELAYLDVPAALRIMPETGQKLRVLPIGLMGAALDSLALGMSNPLDDNAVNEVAHLTQLEIVRVVVDDAALNVAWDALAQHVAQHPEIEVPTPRHAPIAIPIATESATESAVVPASSVPVSDAPMTIEVEPLAVQNSVADDFDLFEDAPRTPADSTDADEELLFIEDEDEEILWESDAEGKSEDLNAAQILFDYDNDDEISHLQDVLENTGTEFQLDVISLQDEAREDDGFEDEAREDDGFESDALNKTSVSADLLSAFSETKFDAFIDEESEEKNSDAVLLDFMDALAKEKKQAPSLENTSGLFAEENNELHTPNISPKSSVNKIGSLNETKDDDDDAELREFMTSLANEESEDDFAEQDQKELLEKQAVAAALLAEFDDEPKDAAAKEIQNALPDFSDAPVTAFNVEELTYEVDSEGSQLLLENPHPIGVDEIAGEDVEAWEPSTDWDAEQGLIGASLIQGEVQSHTGIQALRTKRPLADEAVAKQKQGDFEEIPSTLIEPEIAISMAEFSADLFSSADAPAAENEKNVLIENKEFFADVSTQPVSLKDIQKLQMRTAAAKALPEKDMPFTAQKKTESKKEASATAEVFPDTATQPVSLKDLERLQGFHKKEAHVSQESLAVFPNTEVPFEMTEEVPSTPAQEEDSIVVGQNILSHEKENNAIAFQDVATQPVSRKDLARLQAVIAAKEAEEALEKPAFAFQNPEESPFQDVPTQPVNLKELSMLQEAMKKKNQ